ncbi:MAG TPA: SDR family oxidoreductase [Cellulomonas sp.]
MTDSGAFVGRTALVTGAGGGIGSALVVALLEAGATVVATARTASPARLAAVPDELRSRLDVRVADMRDLPSLPALVASAQQEHGSVDVLIPAAGVGRVDGLDQGLDVWQEALTVNLTAPWVLAQAALPAMTARGWGRILFVSSIAAYTGGKIGPHYSASKAGLHGLTHSIASRTVAQGVTANAIAPALIDGTDMVQGIPDVVLPPVGRFGRPDEVTSLALAMLSNAYLTGQVVLLDGGIRPD